ncbi:hypothetical protein [Humisphaera borealis]|uniref:Uncharacterized protein n=1 Tax=Humisphaera borealis TaxID=2807512 RepID=A0A7M2WYF3_9BACT|nr:hypothetical protein [Humisphaera borealis]QOV90252.1 hypothetical protein IPV69_02435 [Humisphaera borealis]
MNTSSVRRRRWIAVIVAGAMIALLACPPPVEAGLKQKIKSAWNKLRKPPTPKPAGNQALRTGAAPSRAPAAMSPGMMNRAAATPIGSPALAPSRVPPPTGRPMGVANAAAQAPAPSASAQTQWNQPIRPQPVAAVTPAGNRTEMPGSPRRAMADLKTAAKPDVYGRASPGSAVLPPPPSGPPGPVAGPAPAVTLPPPPPPMASAGSAASSVRTPVIYERMPPRPQVMFPIPGPPGSTPPPAVTPPPGPRAPGPPVGPQPVIYSKLPSGGPVAAGGAAGAISASRTAKLGTTPVSQMPPVTKLVPREALVNSPGVGKWTTKDVPPGAAPQNVIGARPFIRGASPDAIEANMRQATANAKQAMDAAARTAPPPTPVGQMQPGLQKAVGSTWQASQGLYGLRMPSLTGNVSPVTASRFNAEYQAILKRTQVTVEK